jgi:hypothetical protein
MVHTAAQIAQLLKSHGVSRMRQTGDHFELLVGGQAVSPKRLLHHIVQKIKSRRPKKIQVGTTLRILTRYRGVMDWDDHRYDYVPKMDFRNDEDRKLNEQCDKEFAQLRLWWPDFVELMTRIRFGEEKIPDELAIKPLPPKPPKKGQLLKCEQEFALIEKARHRFPTKPMSEIIADVAKKLGKTSNAVKGNYYHELERKGLRDKKK